MHFLIWSFWNVHKNRNEPKNNVTDRVTIQPPNQIAIFWPRMTNFTSKPISWQFLIVWNTLQHHPTILGSLWPCLKKIYFRIYVILGNFKVLVFGTVEKNMPLPNHQFLTYNDVSYIKIHLRKISRQSRQVLRWQDMQTYIV